VAQRSAAIQRVLFIGNSLTAANDLPGLVDALSRATPGPVLECKALVFPDYSLEDHLTRGDAVRAIAGGGLVNGRAAAGPVGVAGVPGAAARVSRGR